jgi:hypothetical protein
MKILKLPESEQISRYGHDASQSGERPLQSLLRCGQQRHSPLQMGRCVFDWYFDAMSAAFRSSSPMA